MLRRRLLSSLAAVQHEAEVARKLFSVEEPVTARRLSALGCIKNINVTGDGEVKVMLDLMVPGYPHVNKVKQDCVEVLQKLPWVRSVDVSVLSSQPAGQTDPTKASLSQVKHIIAISSCKGGVGKSTVAVNLACALAQQGLSVGLLDADIYGPSLPFQLPAESTVVKRSTHNPKHILPLTAQSLPNVKLLSFGHVNPNSGAPGAGGQAAAMVRGPVAVKIIQQLLLATDWGALDYLLVDLPPGTGDIHLTVSQLAAFSGAVLVTTPHRLAMVDVVKGMALFHTLDVRTLALVENMSYLRMGEDHVVHPFGRGGVDRLVQAAHTLQGREGKASRVDDIEAEIRRAPYHCLPLVPPQEDEGEGLALPVVLTQPQSEAATTYHGLARSVIERVFATQVDIDSIPSVRWDAERRGLVLRYFTAFHATEYFLPQDVLDRADPQTGELSGNPSGHPVVRVEATGGNWLMVVWKHQSKIFPNDVLKNMAEMHQAQTAAKP